MEPIRHPIWEYAVEVIVEKYTYGDTILHEELHKLFHMKWMDPDSKAFTVQEIKDHQLLFMSNLDRVKIKLLKDHFMLLDSVRSKGYKIVTPEEQTEVVMENARRALRKSFKRGVNGLMYVRSDMLSHDERAKNNIALATMSRLRAMNKKALSQ